MIQQPFIQDHLKCSYKWSLHPFTASIELTLEIMEFLLSLSNMNLKKQHVQPQTLSPIFSILGLNILQFLPPKSPKFCYVTDNYELHLTTRSFSDFTFFYTNDIGYTILLWIKKNTFFSKDFKHALVLKQNHSKLPRGLHKTVKIRLYFRNYHNPFLI